jgi:hypothetical protein
LLSSIDIASPARTALTNGGVEEPVIVGRRGPLAAFATMERPDKAA